MLSEETKMLMMITRHGSSWYHPPLTPSRLPPLSPQHLLPAWLLSTSPCCACHAGLLLPPARLLPTAWDCPWQAGMRQEGRQKHLLHFLHVDGDWRAIGTQGLSQIENGKESHIVSYRSYSGSAFVSSSGTAAAEPLHMPSITEWQGPGSKENRQILKRNSIN